MALELNSGPEVGQLRRSVRGTREEIVLPYANVHGIAIFEGDIVLSSLERELIGSPRGIAVADIGRLWPDRRVHYQLDPHLPARDRARAAIDHWMARTALEFVELPPGIGVDDYLIFIPSETGSASMVGRQFGAQVIELGPDYTSGNAIHEIGHAVGLFHEQSRSDRDSYVRVHLGRVIPGYEHNFQTFPKGSVDVGSYDIGSIMHYPANAFSRDGLATIEPMGKLSQGVVMGQRDGLSPGDIASIASLYG